MPDNQSIVFLMDIIRKSLDDDTLSRSEKKTIRSHLTDARLTSDEQSQLRSELFALAHEKAIGFSLHHILAWLEVLDQSIATTAPPSATISNICFSPGDDCKNTIKSLLSHARRSVDICVFTISDNDLAHAIRDCAGRGVPVRIITDDEKYGDRGSDIGYLRKLGIPVRIDNSPHHMHHKFMIIDGKYILTGSFNWTRSASDFNKENIIVVEDTVTVERYFTEFESLWRECRDLQRDDAFNHGSC
jgi:mitochondrial cardiolipin hydrolase